MFLKNNVQSPILMSTSNNNLKIFSGDKDIPRSEISGNLDKMFPDPANSCQMIPTLPRNYFSSSYEHGCALQEIMSSLQVSNIKEKYIS